MVRTGHIVSNRTAEGLQSPRKNMIEAKPTPILAENDGVEPVLDEQLHQTPPAAIVPGVEIAGKNERTTMVFDQPDNLFEKAHKCSGRHEIDDVSIQNQKFLAGSKPQIVDRAQGNFGG